ncbi:MAG TPA: MFS transporter [Candidatus Krumholzibacteria bacterium]|nr:MFS transporter [Candidatus Krumholzibacteria bacterium]
MIATQIAGKAVRDALFLSNYPISTLPLVLVISAVLSIGAVLVAARWVARYGPARVIPPFFIASGLLLLGEWLLATVTIRIAAVVVYLHVAVISSILISGFWSTINESFDPRTAKRNIGRIAGGATAGGLFGGMIADRVSASLGILWVLPIIAGFHLVCAALLRQLPSHHATARPRSDRPAARADRPPASESGFQVLRRVPYLRNLALVVLLGNAAATLVDFLFKARATQTYATSAELVRFFAIFYTVVSLVTLAVQAGVTRRLIERIGIAPGMAVRPALLSVGGLIVAPFVSLASLGFLRGLEAVVQGSLHRSSYELLFTPVVPGDRRATRTIIDVGADRVGDIVGGVLVRAVILLPAAASGQVLLLLAVAISVLGFLVTRALRPGYVRALEASLINRAKVLELDPGEAHAMPSLMETFSGLDLSMTLDDLKLGDVRRTVLAATANVDEADRKTAALHPPPPDRSARAVDPEVAALVELRSGDARRVRAHLRQLSVVSPVIAGQVTTLLAWDDVTAWASRALARAAPAITGQLIDRLIDPAEDFAVRRRIPRILATCATARACAGLTAALDDQRFEVRFRAAAALASLREREPSLAVDGRSVYAAVLREARVEKGLWENRRLIDDPPPAESTIAGDATLRARSSRSLEYVFTLLSLVLPREPLQISYKGLLTSDVVLRGTSLEYLESVLPRDVWESLNRRLGDLPPGEASRRPPDEVLENLLRSRTSIDLNLDELRKRVGEA